MHPASFFLYAMGGKGWVHRYNAKYIDQDVSR